MYTSFLPAVGQSVRSEVSLKSGSTILKVRSQNSKSVKLSRPGGLTLSSPSMLAVTTAWRDVYELNGLHHQMLHTMHVPIFLLGEC